MLFIAAVTSVSLLVCQGLVPDSFCGRGDLYLVNLLESTCCRFLPPIISSRHCVMLKEANVKI